jgi:hypothetical protein
MGDRPARGSLMARLVYNDGEGVFMNFVGKTEWHARVILDMIGPSLYVVLTPNADIYTQDFSADGGGVSSVRSRGWEIEVPFGIPLDQVYDFAAFPSGAQLRMLLAEGRQAGDRERVARGMPPLGARAPYEAPAGLHGPRAPLLPVPPPPDLHGAHLPLPVPVVVPVVAAASDLPGAEGVLLLGAAALSSIVWLRSQPTRTSTLRRSKKLRDRHQRQQTNPEIKAAQPVCAENEKSKKGGAK